MGGVKLNELALYDATKNELRSRLAGRFPANFDLKKNDHGLRLLGLYRDA
jgi:hypothetical protein